MAPGSEAGRVMFTTFTASAFQPLARVQKRMTDKGLWLDVEVCFASGSRTI